LEIICYSCGRGENPENTLIGIQHCYSINSNWRIEMDVQITADEKLVLFHDKHTERTTGENKVISHLTLDEVAKLNAGYNFKINDTYEYRSTPIRIPELKNVFKEFPHAKLLLDVHSNNPKIVKILINLIDSEFREGDFVIASEYDEIIAQLKRLRPNWIYGVPVKEAKKMLYSSFLRLDHFFPIKRDILMLPKIFGKIEVLNKRVIKHAKSRNKLIWAWMYEGEEVKTVNSIIEIENLKKLGVDGIFTDYPEKISNAIKVSNYGKRTRSTGSLFIV